MIPTLFDVLTITLKEKRLRKHQICRDTKFNCLQYFVFVVFVLEKF